MIIVGVRHNGVTETFNFKTDSEGLEFCRLCKDHGIEIVQYDTLHTISVNAAIASTFVAFKIDLTK